MTTTTLGPARTTCPTWCTTHEDSDPALHQGTLTIEGFEIEGLDWEVHAQGRDVNDPVLRVSTRVHPQPPAGTGPVLRITANGVDADLVGRDLMRIGWQILEDAKRHSERNAFNLGVDAGASGLVAPS